MQHQTDKVEIIDLTPSWTQILPALIAVIQDGNAEGQKHAKAELSRMAQVADKFVDISKTCPNGLDSWHETHFKIVEHLTETAHYSGSLANVRLNDQGTGGLYELAGQMTTAFEQKHIGREWDGDFEDEIETFIDEYPKDKAR